MKSRISPCVAIFFAALNISDALAQQLSGVEQSGLLPLSAQSLLTLGLMALLAAGLFVYWRRASDVARENRTLKTRIDAQQADLKQTTEQVQAYSRAMQAIADIGRHIAAARDLPTLASVIYQRLNAHLDADAFGIGAYDAERQEITYRAFVDMGVKLPEYKISMTDDDRPAVWCVAHKQDMLIGDFEAEYSKYIKRLPAPRAAGQPKSLMFSPVMVDSQAIGVITAQSYKPHAYSQHHLDMLKALASLVAIALERINACDALNQAAKPLKDAQPDLPQSQK